MEKRKVYISGAIAHHDIDERWATFAAAARLWRDRGWEVFNPFDNGVPQSAHWRDHMRADIRALVDCTHIYMLRGWELSKGAKLELDVATSCGLQVILETTNNEAL